ncbi:cytochrome b [Sphingomonas cavernae]|nr:cytochrome b [Sphingomonas cavernae]
MAIRNTVSSWGTAAKLLHWVMALLIIGTSLLVLHVNDSMPWFKSGPLIFITYVHWHKALGLIAFALIFARLAWRWSNPPPKIVELSPIEERAAKLAHRSLYILMVVVPLTGWISSSAFGSPTKFFGLFEIPGIIPKTKALVGPAYWTHFGLSWLLLAAVSFHVIAAFWHHDRKKDDTLRAMWFDMRRSDGR